MRDKKGWAFFFFFSVPIKKKKSRKDSDWLNLSPSAHAEPISKGQLLGSLRTWELLLQWMKQFPEPKGKLSSKELKANTLKTIDIHNKVFVNLHVAVVSYDNTTA